MTCQQIEPLLSPFVDGVAPAEERSLVEAHLALCPSCRDLAGAQASVRRLLQTRRAQLLVPAPPGLRTRIAAAAHGARVRDTPLLGWRGRLSALAAAAAVVLVAGAAVTAVLTPRSTVVLAAQLVFDHIKCFVIDGDRGAAPISAAQAEQTIAREYGWHFRVPDAAGAEGVDLVAVRRCLNGDGLAAHLLYRVDGEPVSLFVMPEMARPSDALRVMGHDHIVWNDGVKTFVLMSRAVGRERLGRVASHLQDEAR